MVVNYMSFVLKLTSKMLINYKNDKNLTNFHFVLFVTEDSGLTIVRRLSGKRSPSQHFHQSELADHSEQYHCTDSQQLLDSEIGPIIENRLEKMQPTSVNDDLESVDLTTESLPAVDTPDACDKAAVR